jgi:anti-anti-sigma factor
MTTPPVETVACPQVRTSRAGSGPPAPTGRARVANGRPCSRDLSSPVQGPRLLPPDHPPSQDVEVEIRPARAPQYAAIVILRGEHDLASTSALRAALSPLFGDVLIDLSECTFVDSSVIGALVAASQALQREGHALSLVVPPENVNVARTLEIVRIGDLLRIHPRIPGVDGTGQRAG